MGSIREYSGLTTKIKAMRSKFITGEEYEKLIECDTVSKLAEYLMAREGHKETLSDFDLSDAHRETIEHSLLCAEFVDFSKIYKFANLNQRKCMKLYFVSYEIRLIKKAIRKSSEQYLTAKQLEYIKSVMKKYSDIDFVSLFSATNISELIRKLQGTKYYEVLKMVEDAGKTTCFDYELALDMFYFRYMWKKRRLYFKDAALRAFSDSIGTEADVLNLVWIYRAKNYYKLTQSEIAAMIIPVYHRVKREDIKRLLDIAEPQELANVISASHYGKYFEPKSFENMELDKVCKKLIVSVYDKYYRNMPYSEAIISSYLKAKSEETDKITTIVECIRYQYSKESIAKEIM